MVRFLDPGSFGGTNVLFCGSDVQRASRTAMRSLGEHIHDATDICFSADKRMPSRCQGTYQTQSDARHSGVLFITSEMAKIGQEAYHAAQTTPM